MFANCSRHIPNVNSRTSAPLRAERKDVGATPPYMRLPAHSHNRASQPRDTLRDRAPTLQASKTGAFTNHVAQDKHLRQDQKHRCPPEQSEAGKDENTFTQLVACSGRASVSLPLYRMCLAHPMLASAFTQGAPAAQDFPSFHQGPLSFNLLPFQRKGNRIFFSVFPSPDVSGRKDRFTGPVASLLKTQHE